MIFVYQEPIIIYDFVWLEFYCKQHYIKDSSCSNNILN